MMAKGFLMESYQTPDQNTILETPLRISKIKTYSDKNPMPVNTNWPGFVKAFHAPDVRGSLPLDQYLMAEKSVRDRQKDGKAIIAGTYSRPGTREQIDLESLSLVTGDIDDSFFTFDALCELLKDLGLESVICTTYSNSPDKPKFRFFILLKNPITTEIKPTLGRIMDYLDERIGHIDPACRKPGQLFYTPACPPGGEAFYQFRHISGVPLDPSDFPAPPVQEQIKVERTTGTKPGDDYNSRVNCSDVLASHGWPLFYSKGNESHHTRPGKKLAVSATVFHDSNNVYIHTSAPEAGPLECGKSYSPFALFALINHDGDYSAAARELAKQGYGDQAKQERVGLANGSEVIAGQGSVTRDVPDLLTDQRIKYYFSKIYQQVVQYVPGIGWHFWDGSRWCTGLPGGLHTLIDKMQRNLLKQSSKIENEKERIERRKALISLESHNRQLTLIQAFQNVPTLITVAEQLDREAMLLNCQNGTVDLKTGILKPHDPADLITRIVNIEYDPAASCPAFMKFITWAMQGDMELAGYLQRFIGYCLTGRTSEQILNFWYGTGGNGKTTLMNIIQLLLGDYATTADTSLIMQRTHGGDGNRLSMLAGLRGSRFVTLSEVNDGEKLDEAAIKSFTGGDRITCRHLYEGFFAYTPQAKLVGFGNYKPHVRGTDHGIWRRIHLVPFKAVISEDAKDPELSVKLKSELPGILAWAVRGCIEWQRAGLIPPAAVIKAVKEYRETEDVFQSWINECCTLDENKRTPAAALMSSFKDYSGWRSMSDRKLGDLLKEYGFQRGRSNGIIWQGISLENGTLEPLPPFPEKSYKKKDLESLPKTPSKVPTFQNSLLEVDEELENFDIDGIEVIRAC